MNVFYCYFYKIIVLDLNLSDEEKLKGKHFIQKAKSNTMMEATAKTVLITLKQKMISIYTQMNVFTCICNQILTNLFDLYV